MRISENKQEKTRKREVIEHSLYYQVSFYDRFTTIHFIRPNTAAPSGAYIGATMSELNSYKKGTPH